MFKNFRYRLWINRLKKKDDEQFQTEIFEAAKKILENGLLGKSMNPSDPKSQVLMTGAMFTVLAGRMEIPIDELFETVSQQDSKFGFQPDRGYL